MRCCARGPRAGIGRVPLLESQTSAATTGVLEGGVEEATQDPKRPGLVRHALDREDAVAGGVFHGAASRDVLESRVPLRASPAYCRWMAKRALRVWADLLCQKHAAQLLESRRLIEEHVEDRARSGMVSATVGWWAATAPSACRLCVRGGRGEVGLQAQGRALRGRGYRREASAGTLCGRARSGAFLKRPGVGLGPAVSDLAEAGRAVAAPAKVSRPAWAIHARCEARANRRGMLAKLAC
jgi:hypothetical protein